MKMPYYVIDAFAEKIFEGGPTGVAVVEEWPSDELLIQIAAENALPETAFIKKLPEGGYHIRWFAPNSEVDLCGHATLATAYAIKRFLEPDIRTVQFKSLTAGDLQVEIRDNGLLEMDLPCRVPEPAELTQQMVDALGGVVPQETYVSRDYFFLLKDEQEVQNLKPDFAAMAAVEYGDGFIVTAPGTRSDFVTRAFFPKLLTDEDHVCGSAHCNLIPFWQKRLGKDEMVSRQLSARGATVYCRAAGDRVKVAGYASLYSIGEIYLSD